MVPPNMFVGATIAYSTAVFYSYYESVPRIWGLSVLEDQMLGGVIMWIPGSMMFIIAALILLARMFGAKDAPPVQPDEWGTDSAMIMPGLEHRMMQNKWNRLQAKNKSAADTR
jgi:cytochrome c oxidase assembly factor CtaG